MTKQQIEALRKLTGQEWHEAGGIVRDDHDHDICVIAEIWKWEPDFGPLTPEKRNDLAIAIAALPDLLAEREKMIAALNAISLLWPKPPDCAPVNPEWVGPHDGKSRAILLEAALDIARKALAEAEGGE